jgi:hypothetical protein
MIKSVFAAATLMGVLGIACSSDEGSEDDEGWMGSRGGSAGSGSIGVGARSGSGVGGGTSGSCQPSPDDAGCVGEQYEGETIPVDVYVMFDQSCSMSCPISRGGPGQCCMGDPNGRILPVREAMDLFVHEPESAGIGFGLGYFGYMEVGDTSCDPNDYQSPAIPVDTNQADAIAASLDRAEPTGETPTGAAIRGACAYVKQAKRQRIGRSVVILLVTDGIPETPVSNCGASLSDAVAAANECALDPVSPTKIYVLGVGQALQNLNQIAVAGRTDRAYLVEGGDVTQSMLAALNAIRGAATIPCDLRIPQPATGQELDYQRVNLGVCDAGGVAKPTFHVETPSQCGPDGGWYYDDPANPQSIVLCEASCATVSVPGAELHYTVGCATRVPVR